MAGQRNRSAADFDAFYAATAAGMVRWLVPLTGDLAEAEDVAQEAYERAWLHWSTVSDCASPEAWVRTVARRLAVSRWRRMRNASTAWVRRTPARDVPDVDPEYLVLIAALRRLPTKQRVAIVLHHLVDLPVEQVAAEMGSSAAAVKKQLTRGRSALSVLLADDGRESAKPAVITLRKDER
jgi:RNA polymerase sigma-70 factor (ECF subfamily)